eukprot:m.808786 g.808786  ORF g.808786 m.808786 type:complete len:102 (+) comp23381_c1_seq49:3166-3471(+)
MLQDITSTCVCCSRIKIFKMHVTQAQDERFAGGTHGCTVQAEVASDVSWCNAASSSGMVNPPGSQDTCIGCAAAFIAPGTCDSAQEWSLGDTEGRDKCAGE